MTGGQALTLTTLLAAAAIFGCCVVVAYHIAWDDEFFRSMMNAGWKFGESDRLAAAGITVFLAFGTSIALVQTQQSIMGWLVKRELQRLQENFRDVEMALGTDAAEAFLAYKSGQLGNRTASAKLTGAIFG